MWLTLHVGPKAWVPESCLSSHLDLKKGEQNPLTSSQSRLGPRGQSGSSKENLQFS